MHRLVHLLPLYARYIVLVLALVVVIALLIWLWISVRGWRKGLGDDS
ncbi:MAG: hypothetical protein ACTHM9_12025 [Gemmatimonadales bacterium]